MCLPAQKFTKLPKAIRPIILLFQIENQRSMEILLEEHRNIYLRHIADLDKFIKGSPFEALWGKWKIDWALYRSVNYSDTLRVLLLYLYGGMYFDLDVISVGRVPKHIPTNFAVAESTGFVNGAILKFSKGHPFLSLLMEEIVSIHTMPIFSIQHYVSN